jgi:UDP:flavonoid glycosyltransferase YjiC (YdhE family)
VRVLFTSGPDLGHFHPLVPIARALAGDGHTVGFAAPETLAPLVARAGFRCFPAGEGRQPSEIFPELSGVVGRERAHFIRVKGFAGAFASKMAADLLPLVRTWRPDLIVRETMEFGGCVAAERLGLPHAVVEINAVGLPPGQLQVMAPALDALRAAHGLPPDPDLRMLHRYLALSQFPPSLRSPAAPRPPTLRAIRPALFDTSGEEGLPVWWQHLPERPTIYATLGTVPAHTGRTDIFAAIIEALRDEPLNLVVTIGRDRDPAEFGRQSPNVRVERYIPQSLLFPRCDLVISHAGSGTVIAALVHGLPMVLLPIAADQPENARHCAEMGVARVLEASAISAEAVREAVLEVLQTPDYRAVAIRLRDEIAALPGPEHAVELLGRLAASREPVSRQT